jgi:hypothetical protein
MAKSTPHSFCFMTKFDLISLQIWILKITGTGMQKMPYYSTKYHGMTLMVICGNLCVQLGLQGPFFPPQDHKFTLIFYKNSDKNFKHLFNYKTAYAILQKDNVTAYTTNNLLLVT